MELFTEIGKIIHIFKKEPREFYNIERLWADAKITRVKND